MILHKKMWWWMMMVMIVVMLMVINVGQRSHIHNLMLFPLQEVCSTAGAWATVRIVTCHRTTVPPYRTWFHLYPLVGCWLYPILKMNWYGQHPTSTYKWKWVQYDGTVRWYGTMVRYTVQWYNGVVRYVWVCSVAARCRGTGNLRMAECRRFCLPACVFMCHVQPTARAGWGHQETRPEAEQTYSMVDGWYSNPWFHPCNGIFQPASLLFDA